jgi:hypothetical protein
MQIEAKSSPQPSPKEREPKQKKSVAKFFFSHRFI